MADVIPFIGVFKIKIKQNWNFVARAEIFFFADILLISSYRQVTKRDVVCFQKGRFNLEEINKIYFRCRQLENRQILRRNEPLLKLRLHAKGKKAS